MIIHLLTTVVRTARPARFATRLGTLLVTCLYHGLSSARNMSNLAGMQMLVTWRRDFGGRLR